MTMSIIRKIGFWLTSLPAIFFAGVAVAHAAPSTGLENPLNSSFSTIPDFIAGVLKVVVMIALPIITIFFVIAGFQFILARGRPGKLDEARKNFVYVVIGALLIMGAWVLATMIAGTVTQLVGKT
ncbi:MAG: hypothetical protein Q7S05_05055 [bacterium]|nr:hypothetical protein [bacterium]